MTTKRWSQERVATGTVVFNGHDCPSCGVWYALTDEYEARRRKDGATFHCPNGHSIVFGDSETDRLKKELDKARDNLASERGYAARLSTSLETERKSHASTKGQLTKTRNRIAAGVCPDCNRHFVNVERHMAEKHGGPGERITPAEGALLKAPK